MANFRIETLNLILRKFSPSDSKDVAYYSKQPKVAYFMADMILHNEPHALSWIERVNKDFNITKPCVILAIENKIEGKCIGVVGIHRKDELDNEVEIFYGISDNYHNKGYATEAAKALIKWVFENTKVKSLIAMVRPDNTASKNVIEKLGFEFSDTKLIPYNDGFCTFNYYKLTKSSNE